MMICAALADGTSVLKGISESEDMSATLDCLSALGAEYQRTGDEVTIRGIHLSGKENETETVFPCRESGSTLRFFIPVALAVCGQGCFTGTKRLIERGIGIYEDLFAGQGIQVERSEDTIRIKGQLKAGRYQIRGDVSSQFVTGMLFALAMLEESSTLEVLPPVESRSYIDITIEVMKNFGVIVDEPSPNCFEIRGGQKFCAGNYRVEGDWSNAAFLYAFQTLGNDLTITGLNPESIQGDRICTEHLHALSGKTNGAADPLYGLHIDLSDTPDLGPVLFAAAAALRGGN